jgi:hypothetical protein
VDGFSQSKAVRDCVNRGGRSGRALRACGDALELGAWHGMCSCCGLDADGDATASVSLEWRSIECPTIAASGARTRRIELEQTRAKQRERNADNGSTHLRTSLQSGRIPTPRERQRQSDPHNCRPGAVVAPPISRAAEMEQARRHRMMMGLVMVHLEVRRWRVPEASPQA